MGETKEAMLETEEAMLHRWERQRRLCYIGEETKEATLHRWEETKEVMLHGWGRQKRPCYIGGGRVGGQRRPCYIGGGGGQRRPCYIGGREREEATFYRRGRKRMSRYVGGEERGGHVTHVIEKTAATLHKRVKRWRRKEEATVRFISREENRGPDM